VQLKTERSDFRKPEWDGIEHACKGCRTTKLQGRFRYPQNAEHHARLEAKRKDVAVDALVGCLTEILREAYRCPDDSLVDIANDAFLSHDIPMLAEWMDDDSDPIKVTPNK